MKKFIPYAKLSKRKQREVDKTRRQDWGGLNPVTRTTPDPKVYDRAKARRWNDDSESGLFAANRMCLAIHTNLKLKGR